MGQKLASVCDENLKRKRVSRVEGPVYLARAKIHYKEMRGGDKTDVNHT